MTRRIHRARFLLVDGSTLIENGYLVTESGRILEFGKWPYLGEGQIVYHGNRLLLPGFVNAHTHLELTALCGMVPFIGGFSGWVASLIEKREALGRERLAEGLEDGIRMLEENGTVAVGEITSLNLGEEALAQSSLSGFRFLELLGSDREVTNLGIIAKPGVSTAFAAHAPHTTDPKLIRRLAALSVKAGRPMSLHLAESSEESAFLAGRAPEWNAFLESRGIDTANWPTGDGVRPVDYLEALELPTSLHLLAVHLLDVTKRELVRLAAQDVKVCLCPRSNRNLHGKTPDLPAMLAAGLKPALGTDSLASVASLDIRDEMRFLSNIHPEIPVSTLFSMGTEWGAEALGLASRFGSLRPGRVADFLSMACDADHPLESILFSPHPVSRVRDTGDHHHD